MPQRGRLGDAVRILIPQARILPNEFRIRLMPNWPYHWSHSINGAGDNTLRSIISFYAVKGQLFIAKTVYTFEKDKFSAENLWFIMITYWLFPISLQSVWDILLSLYGESFYISNIIRTLYTYISAFAAGTWEPFKKRLECNRNFYWCMLGRQVGGRGSALDRITSGHI